MYKFFANLNRLLIVLITVSFAHYTYAARKIVVPHDFPTIHIALGEAEEGDTVYVVKGIYKENVALPDGVVLMGQEMHRTVINGMKKGPCVTGSDGAVVTGFTLTNGTVGVLCKNTRPTIERNFIVDNKGAGIHALISLPDIRNNIIYRNEWTGIFLESVRGTRTSIEHNVIKENGYCGIFAAHRTEVLIQGNILDGNKQFGVFAAPGAKKTRVIYNNFFGNRKKVNSGVVFNKTNTAFEPMYVSAVYPLFNFFLSDKSPCRGKGESGTDIGLITESMKKKLSVDHDGDGILDDIDQCPDMAEDLDSFDDQDGCPDFDNDNDGISDADDKCSDKAEDVDGFEDNDGCPDTDNDHDGIADNADNCPDNPETVNGFKDSDGCPDEKPREISHRVVLNGVEFKTASSELTEDSYYSLEKVYNSMEAYPNMKLEIDGHTDGKGNPKYNMILSYERAKAVKSYLVNRGISTNRLLAKGFGDTKPVATNDTEEGRSKNRRVELVPLRK